MRQRSFLVNDSKRTFAAELIEGTQLARKGALDLAVVGIFVQFVMMTEQPSILIPLGYLISFYKSVFS
jgi:hypothetical protein